MQSGERIMIEGRGYCLGAVLSTGAGSYGQVWAATDDAGRAVALKFINTEAMSQADLSLRGHWRAHLEREIAFLAGLDPDQSRHIVALLDHGEVDGQPVLVLERLTANLGQWLTQQQRDNAPPPHLERILDWAGQILDGLDVIHHAGFVYRDLKLSNILVDGRGERLKLADFGSLKRQNGDSTRSFIGTPATMAPEQALPVRFSPAGCEYAVDHRADYYALGLLLFRLLTRQSATAAQRRLGQLLAQHGQEGAARHGEQLGGLSDEERQLLRQSIEFWMISAFSGTGGGAATQLIELIERLLERDPDHRPGDSMEIREILEAVRAAPAEPSTLAPASLVSLSDWDMPPPTLPPNRHRHYRGAEHRSPWLRRAAALAGLAGLAGALVWAVVIRPDGEIPQHRVVAPDAVLTAAPIQTSAPDVPVSIPSPAPASPTLPEKPHLAAADSTASVAAAPVTDSAAALAVEPADQPVAETKSAPESEAAAKPSAEPVAEAKSAPEPAVAPDAEPVVAAPPAKRDHEAPDQQYPDIAPPIITRPLVERAAPARSSKSPARSQPDRAAATAKSKEPSLPPAPAVAKPESKTPAAPAPGIARDSPRTVKAAPLQDKSVPPTARTRRTAKKTPPSPPTRPVAAAPVDPIARAEPPLRPTPPTPSPVRLESRSPLPPIRLESRPPSAPPTLPPINLVSRTDSPSPAAPTRREQPAIAPKPDALPTPPRNPSAAPKPSAPRPPDPLTQFQEDAARASVDVRRNVEALTRWMNRTGASAGAEIQRGLDSANQAVTRWTRSNKTRVERRDRWSNRGGGGTGQQYEQPPSYDEAEEFAAPPRPQYYR